MAVRVQVPPIAPIRKRSSLSCVFFVPVYFKPASLGLAIFDAAIQGLERHAGPHPNLVGIDLASGRVTGAVGCELNPSREDVVELSGEL